MAKVEKVGSKTLSTMTKPMTSIPALPARRRRSTATIVGIAPTSKRMMSKVRIRSAYCANRLGSRTPAEQASETA